MDLNEILNELKRYNNAVAEFYSGLSQDQINNLERKLNYKLPNDFKTFLSVTNGAVVNCHELYGIQPDKPFEDLFGIYLFQRNEVENPTRDFHLPIYSDGMGNYNCLDLSTLSSDGEICKVIFWQHDWFYSENEHPDIDANSFTQFLEDLLKQIEKEYYYDGTQK